MLFLLIKIIVAMIMIIILALTQMTKGSKSDQVTNNDTNGDEEISVVSIPEPDEDD